MNDASTTEPLYADAEGSAGHGRHRGETSPQDGESAPSGRHRKPEQQTGTAA
ncbi:hypothetical protein ACFXAZ_05805 [Streptomyces sp. NPDC059477]|uniref:hypothetical protein n=1 Tax=Streptomyces sp. NPDC059477 TaxID=3346847 RepID=UPI0036D0816D